MRTLLAALAATTLVAAPVAHAAAPARASLPVERASEMGGGVPFSAIVVLLAVLGGALFLAIDDDDSPDSP